MLCRCLLKLECVCAFKAAGLMADGVYELNFFCQQLQRAIVVVGLLWVWGWVKVVIDDGHAKAGHVHAKLVFFAC